MNWGSLPRLCVCELRDCGPSAPALRQHSACGCLVGGPDFSGPGTGAHMETTARCPPPRPTLPNGGLVRVCRPPGLPVHTPSTPCGQLLPASPQPRVHRAAGRPQAHPGGRVRGQVCAGSGCGPDILECQAPSTGRREGVEAGGMSLVSVASWPVGRDVMGGGRGGPSEVPGAPQG